MALLKFFKRKAGSDKEIIKEQQDNLKEIIPDPTGPLSIAVPSSAIAAANKEVSKVYEEIASGEWRRGPYINLKQASQRCEIGRRAAVYVTTAAMRYHKKNYPKLKLTEPTVRRLKNQYKDEVKKDHWKKGIV